LKKEGYTMSSQDNAGQTPAKKIEAVINTYATQSPGLALWVGSGSLPVVLLGQNLCQEVRDGKAWFMIIFSCGIIRTDKIEDYDKLKKWAESHLIAPSRTIFSDHRKFSELTGPGSVKFLKCSGEFTTLEEKEPLQRNNNFTPRSKERRKYMYV
jgi:hypothetical protein